MKTFQPLFRRFFIAPIVCVLTMAMRVSGAQQEELQRWQYEGNLGESRIGLTLILAGNRIDGGHYFYQKFLRDIPITGSVQGSQVTLTEQGGGVFHLHFVGNGRERNQPLTFENSIGMHGTWNNAGGNRNYSVSFRGTTILHGVADSHRYKSVTNESDVAFEKRVQSLFWAVLKGDKATAVRFISYPLQAALPNGT